MDLTYLHNAKRNGAGRFTSSWLVKGGFIRSVMEELETQMRRGGGIVGGAVGRTNLVGGCFWLVFLC